jgi:hypothetical protein
VAFIGGAASLFIVTVLAENNGAWFPAIARANAAMAETKKRAEQVCACVCAREGSGVEGVAVDWLIVMCSWRVCAQLPAVSTFAPPPQ